ncbi:serine O-acetyltransferase EpsC [Anoxybacillus eryuanensis]|uniref:serine O-acetyltransferase EpsC n=1 Tax=Anoxybacillus eryuanensis TaxID=651866 RepID=UPI003EF7CF41
MKRTFKIFLLDIERLIGTRPNFFRVLKLLIMEVSIQSIFLYRLQDFFTDKKIYFLAKLIRNINIYFTGAEFCIGAKIGPGLIIRHPNGIVIGSGTVIGNNCTILQQVTLGEKYGDGRDLHHRYPKIGDNVVISAGAKIIGGVHVGNNVTIGANAVVTKDVPSNSVAVGIPARIINQEG